MARNLRIPAGTTEIQRAMIAESLAADDGGLVERQRLDVGGRARAPGTGVGREPR